MSYAATLAQISRTPITLVVMTLDYCANTYGVAPCTAPMQVISSGSVLKANMKISPLDGSAHVDFSAASVLTGNLLKYLVIRDSALNEIAGWIRAAGTTEGRGSEIIIDGSFDGAGWGAQAGWSVAGGKAVATNAAVDSLVYQDSGYSGITGGLFKIVFTVSDYTDGSVRFYHNALLTLTDRSGSGTFTEYVVSSLLNGWCGFNIRTIGTDLSISDVSMKLVTAPGPTGATISGTKGGAQNWASKAAGFNYGDPAGYTYIIYEPDSKCYNTFPTCKDRANFNRTTKEYRFSSADSPLPTKTGERPYLKSIRYMPTEIKDSLTVNSRVTLEFYDEEDTDVGIDPYLADRASIQGTFWKKFLARNSNFLGRSVKIFEGFAESDEFTQFFVGEIENIVSWQPGVAWGSGTEWGGKVILNGGAVSNVSIGGGVVKVEIVDLLKSMAKIEIPPKLNIKLAADVTNVQDSMTLSGDDVSSLVSPAGHVRIDDEIIYYTAINTTTKIISGCTRGYFGTTAAAHDTETKVQKVRYFAPGSGFDHLKTILLTDCGIAAGYVDDAEFDTQRDDPAGDDTVNFSAIITEPVKAEELYFELVDLLNCKSWVAEDLKITIKRNLPNLPGRTYTTITDAENIVQGSSSVDLNHKSRISRVSLYWDRTAVGDNDKISDFSRLDLAIDSDAEGVNEYGEIAEKKVLCRWLRSGYDTEETMAAFVKRQAGRLLGQFRDPMPIISFETELKDTGIKTGQYVRITTDELQEKDGADLTGAIFQVIRREQKSASRVSLKCLRVTPKRYAVISPAGYSAKDYATATEAEREYGAICDANNQMPNGDAGYRIY